MIVLDTVSITTGSIDGWLEAVAWVTVATVLATLWALRSYLRYKATDEADKRHIRALRPQLLRGTSVRVRIKRGFDSGDVLRRLREGFDRDERVEERDATARDVAQGLAGAAADARPSWIPVLAWRGILEGVLLIVVGLVAFVPLAYWRAAVDPSPPVSAAEGASMFVSAYGTIVSAILAFPFASTVVDIAIATGIVGLSQLWGVWILPAVLLIAGGLGLARLDSRIRAFDAVPDDVRLVPSRARSLLGVFVWFVLVWFVGVAIAAPFRLLESAGLAEVAIVGEVLGVIGAILVAGVGSWLWTSSIADRIRGIGEIHRAETSAVVSYLVLRRGYLLLAGVAGVLLVGYAGDAIVSGRVLEVLGVIGAAPAWVLAILGLGVISLVVLVLLSIPSVVEDLRDLSSRASRSTALRVWVFARGVPIVATVSTFALVLAFTESILWSTVAAITVGATVRVIGGVISRLKYAAFDRYSGVSRPVREVHVAPFTVEDADGETIWIADVDGERLAHRDRESLLEDVLDLVRARTESGSSPSTESEHYYQRVEMGFVDLERFWTKLGAETRLETRVYLSDVGEVEDDVAREALSREYPEEVVDEAISELRRRGIVNRRGGRLVLKDASPGGL